MTRTVQSLDVLLNEFDAGEPAARDQLLALCYGELRLIARRMLYADNAAQDLQPTELANESVSRILKLHSMDWQGRSHFLATASKVMRQTLMDEVRKARAAKRSAVMVTTQWIDAGMVAQPIDLEALDSALTVLEAISPERARVVELRFFVGLSTEEIADVLETSDSSVKRQWRSARAWLFDQLKLTA